MHEVVSKNHNTVRLMIVGAGLIGIVLYADDLIGSLAGLVVGLINFYLDGVIKMFFDLVIFAIPVLMIIYSKRLAQLIWKD